MDRGQRARGDGGAGMSVATRETAAARRAGARCRPAQAGSRSARSRCVAFAVLLYLGRSTTFYFDEWDWVQGRREWNAAALLEPHNEHLSLVPVLVFKLLFSTVGTDSYVPFRVAGLLLHCARRGAAVRLRPHAGRRAARARRGGGRAVPRHRVARRAVAVPDRLPRLARRGHRGAARARPRGPPRRRDRRGAARRRARVVLARAAAAGGLALEVLGRPDRRSRWWIVAAPAALYAVWYLAYGGEGTATSDNLFGSPGYVADAAAGAAGALFSLDMDWGRPLAVVGRRRAAGEPAPARRRRRGGCSR